MPGVAFLMYRVESGYKCSALPPPPPDPVLDLGFDQSTNRVLEGFRVEYLGMCYSTLIGALWGKTANISLWPTHGNLIDKRLIEFLFESRTIHHPSVLPP